MERNHLSKAIAYAAGLTHKLYEATSNAKWYFMMFRVVELFHRVKENVSDEATQLVILECFQVMLEKVHDFRFVGTRSG
jgi:hypothetical protein